MKELVEFMIYRENNIVFYFLSVFGESWLRKCIEDDSFDILDYFVFRKLDE